MANYVKSKVIGQERCPQCAENGADNSEDNLVLYEDGSNFCYSCYKKIDEALNEENMPKEMKITEKIQRDNSDISSKVTERECNKKSIKSIAGEYLPLTTRKLTKETVEFCNIQVGRFTGNMGKGKQQRQLNNEPVMLFNYGKSAQKVKTQDKLMFIAGDGGESMPLFLQDKFLPNPNLYITVTEGEEDAASIVQVYDGRYPVVSVPKGSGQARAAISTNLKYLLGFKYVILGFDNDESGQKAVKECLTLFEPGKVRVAKWKLKDANDMLKAGMIKEIKDCITFADEMIPESIVTVSNVLDRVLVQPKYGIEYPWPTWTKVTYGLQMGEIHIIVASPAVGKTEIVKDMIFHFLDRYDFKIGLFSFEQTPENTIRRLVGAKLNIKLHLPGEEWNESEIRKQAMAFESRLFLYDKAGRVDIQDLFHSIRYLAKARNVSLFIIDNIKALGIATDNDAAQSFMNKLKSLMKELNTTVILLSHVSKDKYSYSTYVTTSPKNADTYNSANAEENSKMVNKPGLEWETGRMPTTSNVEGGNVIVALSDYVFGLARNRTSDNEQEKRTMRVKALKTRLDSAMDGKTFKLFYTDQGRLEETEPFKTESKGIF